jgi:hypothetical protein
MLTAFKKPKSGRSGSRAVRYLSNREKLLAFFFTLILLGMPMMPSLMHHAGSRPKFIFPAFLCIAAASVLFKSALRNKSRVLALILAALFYIPAFAYIWLIFVSVFVSSIAIPLIIFIWCASILIFYAFNNIRLYFLAHLFGCAILFFSVLQSIAGSYRYTFGFLFFIYLVICSLVWRRKAVLAFFSPVAILCLTAGTLTYSFTAFRYSAVYSDQTQAIAAQQNVRLLHAYDRDSDLMGLIGHNHMFAARFGEDIFIGPHNGEKEFFLIPDSKSIQASDIKRIKIGTRAGDMAAYIPNEPDAILAGSFGKLFLLRRDPFRIESTISTQSRLINFIRVDPVNGFVFASQDNGQNVLRFRLQNLHDVSFSPPIDPWSWFFDVAVDPTKKRFYVCPIGFQGVRIVEGDIETLSYTRQAQLKGVMGFMVEIDPDGRQLFIGSFYTGELIVCDLDDLSTKARIPMGMSIRDLTFDPKRRRLYAVNYFAGKIIVLDADRLAIINSVDVGSIARHANLSRDGDELVIRSGAGIFSIDLNMIENRENDLSLGIPTTLSITKPIIYHSLRFLFPLFIRLNDLASG